jgi:hypothetical protein
MLLGRVWIGLARWRNGGPVGGRRRGRSLRRAHPASSLEGAVHAAGAAMRRWASTSGGGGGGGVCWGGPPPTAWGGSTRPGGRVRSTRKVRRCGGGRPLLGLGGERVGGWEVVPHGGGWQYGERSAGGGMFFLDRSQSPRLCVAVGIPGGGRRRDFQRVWEGPGVDGWWSGAFHTRSDSTAGVGGRFGSGPAATWRDGRGEVCGVPGMVPGVPRTVRGPRGTAARTVGAEFLRPPPRPPAFGAALSRMVDFQERNETPTAMAPQAPPLPGPSWACSVVSPDGIYEPAHRDRQRRQCSAFP